MSHVALRVWESGGPGERDPCGPTACALLRLSRAVSCLSPDSLGWKIFYVTGCLFVAVQNLEDWEVRPAAARLPDDPRAGAPGSLGSALVPVRHCSGAKEPSEAFFS